MRNQAKADTLAVEASTADAFATATYRPHDGRNRKVAAWFEQWSAPMQRWVGSHSAMSMADLDDLAQETFLRLLRYSSDTVIEHPQTYLFRIASNVASEWRERARNSRPHEDTWLDDLQVEPTDEPENLVARTLVSEHVRTAVERLPQRQREVLMLHITEELTYAQIAKRLSLTRRIVRRDLTRAYAQLRLDLDPFEGS